MLIQYSLSVMGIVFGILGALFLSMEVIGLDRFKTILRFNRNFSVWYKKSIKRMCAFLIPPFIILMIGGILENPIIIGLFLPILFFLFLFSFLVDNPELIEKWILIKSEKRTIGLFGFILLLIGSMLHLCSLVIQMATTQ